MESYRSFDYGVNDTSGYQDAFEMATPPYAFGLGFGAGVPELQTLGMYTSEQPMPASKNRVVGQHRDFEWGSFKQVLSQYVRSQLMSNGELHPFGNPYESYKEYDPVQENINLWKKKVDELILTRRRKGEKTQHWDYWAGIVYEIFTGTTEQSNTLRMVTFSNSVQAYHAFRKVVWGPIITAQSTPAPHSFEAASVTLEELKLWWEERTMEEDPNASHVAVELDRLKSGKEHEYWDAPKLFRQKNDKGHWYSFDSKNASSTWETAMAVSNTPATQRFTKKMQLLSDELQSKEAFTNSERAHVLATLEEYRLAKCDQSNEHMTRQFGHNPEDGFQETSAPDASNMCRYSALQCTLFGVQTSHTETVDERINYVDMLEYSKPPPDAPTSGGTSAVEYFKRKMMAALLTQNCWWRVIPDDHQVQLAKSMYAQWILSAQGIQKKGRQFLLDVVPIWREHMHLAKKAADTNVHGDGELGLNMLVVYEPPEHSGAIGRWKIENTAIWTFKPEGSKKMKDDGSVSNKAYAYYPMPDEMQFKNTDALEDVEKLIMMVQGEGTMRYMPRYSTRYAVSDDFPYTLGYACPEYDKISSFLKRCPSPPIKLKPPSTDRDNQEIECYFEGQNTILTRKLREYITDAEVQRTPGFGATYSAKNSAEMRTKRMETLKTANETLRTNRNKLAQANLGEYDTKLKAVTTAFEQVNTDKATLELARKNKSGIETAEKAVHAAEDVYEQEVKELEALESEVSPRQGSTHYIVPGFPSDTSNSSEYCYEVLPVEGKTNALILSYSTFLQKHKQDQTSKKIMYYQNLCNMANMGCDISNWNALAVNARQVSAVSQHSLRNVDQSLMMSTEQYTE